MLLNLYHSNQDKNLGWTKIRENRPQMFLVRQILSADQSLTCNQVPETSHH